MLKVRLSESRHVFLAKGFTPSDLKKMHTEAKYYDHLRRLQGVHVSVCMGTIELQGDEILKYDTWDGELVIAGLPIGTVARLGWLRSRQLAAHRNQPEDRQATLLCAIFHSRCARPCRKFTGTWP